LLDVELYRVPFKLSRLYLGHAEDVFHVKLEELTAGFLDVRALINPIADAFQEQMVFFVNLVLKLFSEGFEVSLVLLHDLALNDDGV
jgi:hypothetical protein